MSGSRHHLQRASLAAHPVGLFSISSQNEDPSVTRQGLSAAPPHTASPCGQDYRLPGSGRSASSPRASRRLISEVNEPTRRSWREGSLHFPSALLTHNRARNFTNFAPLVDVRDIQAAHEFGRDHLQPPRQIEFCARTGPFEFGNQVLILSHRKL